MKDIDWSKVDKDRVYLVQNNRNGGIYTCSQNYLNSHKYALTILAERPKPQLTDEQIEEEAALHVEKIRVNPGNYADKKKFEVREYSDAAYAEEIERVAWHCEEVAHGLDRDPYELVREGSTEGMRNIALWALGHVEDTRPVRAPDLLAGRRE